jgi:NADPH:quinone reductase
MHTYASTTNTVVLAARPRGYPKLTDFALTQELLDPPEHGEVLLQSLFLSLDPYQRGRMNEAASYAASLQIGDPMPGSIVGRVLESRDPGFAVGDAVEAVLTWSDHHRVPGSVLRKLDETQAPLTSAVGLLGIPGLSAWFGLMAIGRPRPGDMVVVSAASGAVGQVVGQLARIAGCRTVGIAGAPEKVAHLTTRLGYDAAVSYREDGLAEQLAVLCPDGVDVYFDNVGGHVSDAVVACLADHARIVVCGRMSQNNRETPDIGPRDFGFLTTKEARMEGFLLRSFAPRFDEARTRLAALHNAGRVVFHENVVHGPIDHAPEAFIGMLRGDHLGKVVLALPDANQ